MCERLLFVIHSHAVLEAEHSGSSIFLLRLMLDHVVELEANTYIGLQTMKIIETQAIVQTVPVSLYFLKVIILFVFYVVLAQTQS